jgi:hypothetical protein
MKKHTERLTKIAPPPRHLLSSFFCLGFAVCLALAGCDDFNRPVKEEIEYYLSITPVSGWEELRGAINAVPGGGTARIVLTADTAAASAPITISGGKTITLEAYKGDAVRIDRAAGFNNYFLDISGGSLVLNGGRDGGRLTLDGGAIGGGIADDPLIGVDSGGFLTLNDGVELRNNNAASSSGGGVSVVGDGASFTMNGGIISGNEAYSGGGVSVGYDASFTMNGGIISGNTASVSGGGVYVYATFRMGGSAVVDVANPVYLCSGKTISVAAPLSPPGGIAAVITSAVTATGTVIVEGNSTLYTLTQGDVGKFRYLDSDTLLDWDAVDETGEIPQP